MGAGFQGRRCIVTGAGGGVGRAVALRLAEEGARLLLSDSDEAGLAETLERAGSAEPLGWRCDLGEKLGVANLVAHATEHFDGVDALFNCATAAEIGDPLSMDIGALDAALDRNLRAVFLLSQHVANRMVENGGEESDAPRGAIVNLSSISSALTSPELLAFSVSCAALEQMTRSMAVALAPRRIRVNAVATGAVMTRSLRDALREHRALRDAILAATPLGRIAEAEEAADAMLFLASPRARFVTGAVLTVDGGRSLIDPLAANRE